MIWHSDYFLRNQLQANPEKVTDFQSSPPPGCVAFLENESGSLVTVSVWGGHTLATMSAASGAVTPNIALQPYGKAIITITKIPKFLFLFLNAVSLDPVRVTLVGFYPKPTVPDVVQEKD